MAQKSAQTKTPGSSAKSNPMATVSATSASPAKPQKASPSQAQIAQVAYEIWIATGKEPGRDEKNWFEAEWQLRQM